MSFISIVKDVVELLTNSQRTIHSSDEPPTQPSRRSKSKSDTAHGNRRNRDRKLSPTHYRWEASNRAVEVDRQKRDLHWIPPGNSIVIQGRRLSDGMIYVGSRLDGVSGYLSVEPALIDPSLPVDNLAPDVDGDLMWYWPSYSDLEPASRAAYLNWLAAGRPGGADIGYVFLFFYGIERRILFETDPEKIPNVETELLILEVERLLDLYRGNRSFNGYAGGFLSFVRFMHPDLDISAIEPPFTRLGWELPLELKLGLGHLVRSGDPIPAKWALSWLRVHPESSFRTAATRCQTEFDELLTLRYRELHDAGMIIRPNKTRLKHSYRPASSSFDNAVELEFPNLPDVTRLKRPIRNLQKLAEQVTDDLDSYSRWIGRHGDRDSLSAVALLPTELVRGHKSRELETLNQKLKLALAKTNAAEIEVSKLVKGFPSRRTDRFSAKEAKTFAELIEKLGFGIEPDIRYSKINLTKHERASIFRLDGEVSQPNARYHAATVLLHLGAAVAVADDMVTADEMEQLGAHMEQSLGLGGAERKRLKAHLQWLLAEPPTLTRMKSRIKGVSQSDLDRIAKFVITIAGADGTVSSAELNVLSRVYNLIGLNDERLHREIHGLAVAPAKHPVTVIRSDASKQYQIPSRPEPDSKSAGSVELDPERVAEVMEDTRAVSDLLTEIFEGHVEDDSSDLTLEDDRSDDDAFSTSEIEGRLLDKEHAQLVQLMSSRPTWSRAEVEYFASDVGLMPAGAIETINEAAFVLGEGPLIEGDDPLEIDQDMLTEMLNVT